MADQKSPEELGEQVVSEYETQQLKRTDLVYLVGAAIRAERDELGRVRLERDDARREASVALASESQARRELAVERERAERFIRLLLTHPSKCDGITPSDCVETIREDAQAYRAALTPPPVEGEPSDHERVRMQLDDEAVAAWDASTPAEGEPARCAQCDNARVIAVDRRTHPDVPRGSYKTVPCPTCTPAADPAGEGGIACAQCGRRATEHTLDGADSKLICADWPHCKAP